MNNRDLVELLARHADLLNMGDDRTSAYVRQYALSSEAAALFHLARSAKAALKPVDPRIGFQAQLYNELMQVDPWYTLAAPGRISRRLWVGAATFGSLISLAGLFFWLRRQRGEAAFIELSAG
jgi:hypothetical protein